MRKDKYRLDKYYQAPCIIFFFVNIHCLPNLSRRGVGGDTAWCVCGMLVKSQCRTSSGSHQAQLGVRILVGAEVKNKLLFMAGTGSLLSIFFLVWSVQCTDTKFKIREFSTRTRIQHMVVKKAFTHRIITMGAFLWFYHIICLEPKLRAWLQKMSALAFVSRAKTNYLSIIGKLFLNLKMLLL